MCLSIPVRIKFATHAVFLAAKSDALTNVCCTNLRLGYDA